MRTACCIGLGTHSKCAIRPTPSAPAAGPAEWREGDQRPEAEQGPGPGPGEGEGWRVTRMAGQRRGRGGAGNREADRSYSGPKNSVAPVASRVARKWYKCLALTTCFPDNFLPCLPSPPPRQFMASGTQWLEEATDETAAGRSPSTYAVCVRACARLICSGEHLSPGTLTVQIFGHFGVKKKFKNISKMVAN